ALPLTNPVGTAPCFLSEDVAGRGCIISLPGVPRELEYMMKNTVIPLLIERMGGVQVVKVRILRTAAVGESNVDRGIGDLMTVSNPTVGLAAHAGQTDVRITAKAPTEEEAEALIGPMETKLRERLGVAIYGTGKETVAQVVGQLLVDKGLQLGVVDTLTGGQLVRELVEAGFRDVISTDLNSDSPATDWSSVALEGSPTFAEDVDIVDLTTALAAKAAPAKGLSLALLGPTVNTDGSLTATHMALHGPADIRLSEPGRVYQDTDYTRRWLVTQGLDWVRRAALGEMVSPVDWK
ncbi:MAG: hypothetical protein AAF485_23655, partial [Chloroflexota bacterium]